MKLAILAQAWLFDDTASVNGTLVQLHNLAIAYAQRGIEVHYITSTLDAQKIYPTQEKGITFHWVKTSKNPFSWIKQIFTFKRLVEGIEPDAVYVRGRNVFQFVAGRYARKHKKIYVWGTNGDNGAEYWKNTRKLLASARPIFKKAILIFLTISEDIFINRGIRLSHLIINQNIKQQLETRKNLKRDSIIIPNYFLPVPYYRQKENRILWLATLAPFKQPEIFIDLIKQTKLHGWEAVIGGGTSDPKYEAKIRNLVLDKPIKILGSIPFEESFEHYQKARLFVSTSKWEGLSNAFIQSWLSGTPVLSLNSDPNNWLNEKNIGFYAQGDFIKLKQKLQELINNPEEIERMGEAARDFAAKTFSSETIIDKYLLIFNGGPLSKE